MNMASKHNYRLYTFTANLYLSDLQKGLQSGHVVGELNAYDTGTPGRDAFDDWSLQDKTMIICGAGNHGGVLRCYDTIQRLCDQPGADIELASLAHSLFREDEESMNGMATACGVIVPEKFWNTKLKNRSTAYADSTIENSPDDFYYEHVSPEQIVTRHYLSTPIGEFIHHIKGYRLA